MFGRIFGSDKFNDMDSFSFRKFQVYNIIVNSSRGGVTKEEISKRLNIDIRTLHPVISNLLSDGKVCVLFEKDRYFPSVKALQVMSPLHALLLSIVVYAIVWNLNVSDMFRHVVYISFLVLFCFVVYMDSEQRDYVAYVVGRINDNKRENE